MSDLLSAPVHRVAGAQTSSEHSTCKSEPPSHIVRLFAGFLSLVFALIFAGEVAYAQKNGPLKPGEAFATRFSGTIETRGPDGRPVHIIDTNGIVGTIIDIRVPGFEPRGEHWLTEPQRAPLTAAEVGQIFGIAIDDWDPANIYVAASSAYGLHLTETGEWMPGQWGPLGGPGTIYKLHAENDYRPQVFAEIELNGRPNSGPGLGNIAYDRWHEQLFVSDLETGMIHRVDTETGDVIDHFNHGLDGRSAFIDAETGEYNVLPVVDFDPQSAPDFDNCEEDFSQTPECWNVADYRRRVWGLGVFANDGDEDVRLYYAVWSSDPLNAEDWADNPEDQRNSIWSVGLNDDGSFNIQDVRREVILPPFDDQDTNTGTAISDIAFSADGTMLLAERGGLRNLGLGIPQTFATPSVSRVLQYKLRETGTWELIARFDVGFYDRANDGPPYLRSNGSGGVDFGYGYTSKGIIDPRQPERMMWTTGDYLCSPQGPCNDPDTGAREDEDEVHGLQGTPRNADSTLLPEGALLEYSFTRDPYSARGPNNSYLIDLDLNIDGFGRIDEEQATRDDSTRSGDVEIYRVVATEPPPPLHAKQLSAFHNKYQSGLHDKVRSLPIHSKSKSHNKVQSTGHVKPWSHHKPGSHAKAKSVLHVKPYSHYKPQSLVHVKPWSHHKPGSHKKSKSLLHVKPYSHYKPKSTVHVKPWSHFKPGSHSKAKSNLHVKPFSHFKPKSKVHVKPWSHFKPGSHSKAKSNLHVKPFSHFKPKSKVHVKPWSHHKPGSHAKAKSVLHVKPYSHFKPKSVIKPQHVKPWSHYKPGSHAKAKSVLHVKPHSHFKPKSVIKPKPQHVKPWSHYKPGSHKKSKSNLHVKPHSHFKPKSVIKPQPQHVKPWSHYKPGSHKKSKSNLHVKPYSHFKPKSVVKPKPIKPKPQHVKPWSHFKPGSHAKSKSNLHVKPYSHYKPKSVVKPKPIKPKPIKPVKPVKPIKPKPVKPVKPKPAIPGGVQIGPCTGGQVLTNGVCRCPAYTPVFHNGRCVRKADSLRN